MPHVVSGEVRAIGAMLVALLFAFSALAQASEAAPVALEEPEASTEPEVSDEDTPPKVADEATKEKLDADPRFSTPPPTLDATAHDLLLLNSGEWLQGNIDGIRDDVIDFDSVELEDIEIDLEDVKEIHANRVHTYRFEGRRDILTGPARMNGEIFIVDGQERPRSAFMSQVPGKPREINYWSGDLSAGYSIRSGNTDQSDLTARAELDRVTSLTRFNNIYNAAFSTGTRDDGSTGTTANSHRLNSALDYFVTNRLYLIIPAAEVFADEFQNIDLRVTPSAGLGYEWLKRKRLTWGISATGGFQYTDLVSAEAGESTTSNDGVVILGTTIEADPTSDIEWDTSYSVQVVPADPGRTNHHLESIFSIDLFFDLDFDVSFIWDRIEEPAEDADGVVPEQNDYRLTFGLGWDF